MEGNAQRPTLSAARFARAMQVNDASFAKRIDEFEASHGEVDRNALSVLGQVNYLCWFHADYRANLAAACRAIGTGRATGFRYHCQITPERWQTLNAYVVGVGQWLGATETLPSLDTSGHRIVARVKGWLGREHSIKRTLAQIFLARLVDDLLNRASFASIGATEASTSSTAYGDFSAWYKETENNSPGEGSAEPTSNEGSAATFQAHSRRIDSLLAVVRTSTALEPDHQRAAQDIAQRILASKQPPCMHRYTRYLDLQLAAIGALRWRGQPACKEADQDTKATWRAFWTDAEAALNGWLLGESPVSSLDNEVHTSLGKSSPRRRTIVRDFLLAPPTDGAVFAWDWLAQQAQTAERIACTVPAHEKSS